MKKISLMLASLMASAQSMASLPELPKKKTSATPSSGRDKRVKGKRSRSKKIRANRRKAKAKH